MVLTLETWSRARGEGTIARVTQRTLFNVFVDADHDGLASLADLKRAITNDTGGLTASYLGLDTSALSLAVRLAVPDELAFQASVSTQLEVMLQWNRAATCTHLGVPCLDVATFSKMFSDPSPPPPFVVHVLEPREDVEEEGKHSSYVYCSDI